MFMLFIVSLKLKDALKVNLAQLTVQISLILFRLYNFYQALVAQKSTHGDWFDVLYKILFEIVSCSFHLLIVELSVYFFLV
jgi:hypothetical protein